MDNVIGSMEIQEAHEKLLSVEEIAGFLRVSQYSVRNYSNPRSLHYIPGFPRPIKIGRKKYFIEREFMDYVQVLKNKRL